MVADAPGWPCLVCGVENALEATFCTTCGAAFLEGLGKGSAPALRLPVVGDIVSLPRSARAALAIASVLVATLLLFGWFSLLAK